MRKIAAFILALSMLCFTFFSCAESSPAFYRVSDEAGHEIYLLGTIHTCFPEALDFPAVILDAFKRSDVLAVELDMVRIQDSFVNPDENMTEEEMSAMLTAVLTIMYSETTLDVLLGEEDFLKCCELLEVEASDLEHISAGFLTTYLGQKMAEKAGCTSDSGVDIFLTLKAHECGKPVLELEDISEQMDALYTAPVEVQVEEAKEAIKYFDESVEQIAAMSRAWMDGDIDGLKAILFTDASEADRTPEEAEQDARLGTDRNVKFIRRAEGFLAEGTTAFIAIGAAHILADDGLVEALTKAGYTVELLCPIQ